MKIQIFVAFLAFVASIQANVRNEKDSNLKGFMEDILNSTISGIVSSLSDPITINKVNLDFSNSTFMDGRFNLSGLNIAGVKKLVASYIQVNGSMGLNMTLNVPEVTVTTQYEANVVLGDLVPLYGNGRASVKLDDLSLNVSGQASILPVGVKNMTVLLAMNDANFVIGGLLNNTEFSLLINQILDDNVVPFMNNNKELISGLISGIVQNIFNSIFKGATTDEVFEVTCESIKNSQLGQFVTIN